MEIVEERLDNALILEPAGRIDSSNAGEFTEHLTSAVDNDSNRVVVDLGQLEYMSSAGFRSLLVAAKKAKAKGCDLSLCRLEGRIRDLFELGGFLNLFVVYQDRQTAIEA